MTKSATREAADGELFKSTGIDDNATSTAVTIDASENVGVGTASPSEKLHIGASGNDDKNSIRIDGSSGSGQTWGTIIESDGENSRVSFKTGGNNSTPTQKLMIHPDGGICFGTDTAAANALDDYEEGSWTSSFANSSITDGSYVKIGRMVYILGKASCTGAGGSGTTISGLPFAPANVAGQQGCGIVGYHNRNTTEVYSILISQTSSTFTFRLASTAVEISAGANFRFNLSYPTNL